MSQLGEEDDARARPPPHKTLAKPLRPSDPDVVRNADGILAKNQVTNNVTFTTNIHEEPNVLLDSLLGDQISTANRRLYQEVIKEESDGTIVTYWSFMLDEVTAAHTVLRMVKSQKVQDNDEIRIQVSSVDEEKELEDSTLPSPFPTVAKNFQLLLNEGTIILEPLSLGQTSFTFIAQASLGVPEEKKDYIASRKASSTSSLRRSTPKNSFIQRATNFGFSSGPDLAKIGFGVIKAEELFNKIASMLYDRFKKEDVIDKRMKEDFIANVPSAPALTPPEEDLIKKSLDLAKGLSMAKRVVGTVREPVENFFHRSDEGAGWAKSVAKIHCPAIIFFAELWLLDAFERKVNHKGEAIYDVIRNIDGTRAMQYSRSISLPRGFQDRLFQAWMTWAIIHEGGRRTFVIAFAPLAEYGGTQHPISGTEKMTLASSSGVHIVKEITDHICEWTRAQRVDLNIALSASMLDFLAKQQLAQSNVLQEKHMRNGKEVDREVRDALAVIMIEERGTKLMEDQVVVFDRCLSLLGDGEDQGWKSIKSPSPDVEMKMKYFPPKNGERSIGTGKAVGVIDCTAEEVAAWVMDYTGIERMRVDVEEGNLARLEARNIAKRTMHCSNAFATSLKNP
ncbi:hypothetical protein TrST_g3649 [Triparma strigata]|uniref:Uncharacterized protein n=1 Tax=Triparma strigata TaxID=1606541 RepID=A0A9W7BJ25_9STRA|nr:hypothetical protein TrST_g3649 [Triparma strigata]